MKITIISKLRIFAVTLVMLTSCNSAYAIDDFLWRPQTLIMTSATGEDEQAFYKVALGFSLNCIGILFTDDAVKEIGSAKECKNIIGLVDRQMRKKNVDKSNYAYFRVPVKSHFRDITEIGLHFDEKQSDIVWRINKRVLPLIDIFNKYNDQHRNLKVRVNDDFSKEISLLFSKNTAEDIDINSPLIRYVYLVDKNLARQQNL